MTRVDRRPMLYRLSRSVRLRPLPVLLALAVAVTVLSVGGSQMSPKTTPAADLSQFNAGNIISDQMFFFGAGMSVNDIQSFLVSRNQGCRPGADGTPCLQNYTQDTGSIASDAQCNGYVGAPHESAATILSKVGLSCNINPKVLLVTLQKERSLVTATGNQLDVRDYQITMGYGCPDSGPCDPTKYGFLNQIYHAAWQFQYYADHPNGYTYRAGHTVNIQYNPNTACGSAPVAIQNQATAGLYIYTPYQPNAAALRGGGDSCSAYGNRNFWAYFTDWFVSTQSDAVVAASPWGVADSITATPAGFTASGWSFDPDATSLPVKVRATVDGTTVASVSANGSRPDVGAAFGVTNDHGWTINGLLAYGDHQVCIVADNLAGWGVQRQLGCALIAFTNRAPKLNIDAFDEQPDGTVLLSGWAYDPDGTPAQVHVYDNGVGHAYDTTVARPDVQTAFSLPGPNVGFSISLGPLSAKHQVCVFAVDTSAPGNNWLSSCRNFAYQQPWSSLDNISQTATGDVHVSGWAFDPSVPATSTQVHVYVDGRGYPLTADVNRPDIARAFPGVGAAHGFDATVPAGPGTHQVCVFPINIGVSGVNPLLGCWTVNIKYTAPFGVVDSVSAIGDGKVAVNGWVLDPDVPTAPVSIHNYVDGVWQGGFEASGSRPDIAAAFPGYGPAHGFSRVLELSPGSHSICTFAINIGVTGTNPFMGCATVNVFDRAPIGSLDSAAFSSPGQFSVSGWTFDQDAPAKPVSYDVTVDGTSRGTFTANVSRPDVGAVYPAAGGQHGFRTTVPVGTGAHDVCVSVRSTSTAGTPSQLGCAHVTS